VRNLRSLGTEEAESIYFCGPYEGEAKASSRDTVLTLRALSAPIARQMVGSDLVRPWAETRLVQGGGGTYATAGALDTAAPGS
jgi:hypothetical protein